MTSGEVRHAVRHEMAVTLADAVLRRTETASGGHPGRDALRTAAAVMAEELDWSSDDTEQQISAVERTLRVAE